MTDHDNSQRTQGQIEDEEFTLLAERLSSAKKSIHFPSPCDIPQIESRRAELRSLDIKLALDNVQAYIDKFKEELGTTPSELELAASVLNCLLAFDAKRNGNLAP